MAPDILRPYAALYWTFPVPWAGFNALPKDVDAAAAKSRTVRYQRDLVRAHVAAERGTLLKEFVFLETSPDHATDAYREVMAEILDLCGTRKVCLAYVDFAAKAGWRKHGRLAGAIEAHDLRTDPLHPRSIDVDGEPFSPDNHFREWRKVDEAFRQKRALTAREALAAAADAIGPGYGRNVEIAARLNGTGVATHSGKAWTAENVRMALKNLETDEIAGPNPG